MKTPGFLAESWHNRSGGAFAASCVGVALLTVSVEFMRRVGKEYDAVILRQFQRSVAAQAADVKTANGSESCASNPRIVIFRATPVQQLIRAVIHAITFGVAYIVMLLGESEVLCNKLEDTDWASGIAMYFNGYIIISIFIGAGIGKFLCDWMVQRVTVGGMLATSIAEGIEEPTVCCG